MKLADALVRSTDPITAKAAAVGIAGRLGTNQRAVLRVFYHFPEMTDGELRENYAKRRELKPSEHPEQAYDGFQKRRGELVEQGLVVNSGKTRDGMIVWRLEEGFDKAIRGQVVFTETGRPITFEDAAKCARREVGKRRHVYENKVRDGTMTPAESAREIEVMSWIQLHFERLVEREKSQTSLDL